jgi:voltage-gated potassium channel
MSNKKADPRVDRWEAIFEKPMIGLSLIFLLVLLIPSVDHLDQHWLNTLHAVDIGIWIIFALDYFIKLAISTDRWSYIKSHILELAIVALPAIRPLRLLRILPIIGFFLKRTQQSLSSQLFKYFALAAVFVTTPIAFYMLEIERNAKGSNIKTVGDALWWAITTLTTVGYGDRYPVTPTGRVLGAIVMLIAVSLVGIITASIASWLVKMDEEQSDKVQLKQLMDRLDAIEKKIDKLN